MAVTEKQRHELFKRIEEALGPEHAETMMELLPPVGWADVATKHDLEALRRELASKDDLHQLRRDVFGWMVGLQASTIAILGLLITLR